MMDFFNKPCFILNFAAFTFCMTTYVVHPPSAIYLIPVYFIMAWVGSVLIEMASYKRRKTLMDFMVNHGIRGIDEIDIY